MAEEIKCKQEECSIKNFEDFIRVEESESEFSQDIDIKICLRKLVKLAENC